MYIVMNKTNNTNEDIRSASETHPLEPFLPKRAQVLMLGSFPPKRERWSMEFFYPNFQNDMWRIMGLVFFGNKDRFVIPERKTFDKDSVVEFCREKGIALFDTASEVVRMKDNASDKFLEVVKSTDIVELLSRIPDCKAVIVTGEKAAETFAAATACNTPSVGNSAEFTVGGRMLRIYRLPSTSRAYPKPLAEKADAYRKLFMEIGIL